MANWKRVHSVVAKLGNTNTIYYRQERRYCSYSRGDFAVFRPAWAARSTDYCQLWHGAGNRRLSTSLKISHRSGDIWGFLTKKLKNHEFCKLIRPGGANSLIDIYEIYLQLLCTYRVCKMF